MDDIVFLLVLINVYIYIWIFNFGNILIVLVWLRWWSMKSVVIMGDVE